MKYAVYVLSIMSQVVPYSINRITDNRMLQNKITCLAINNSISFNLYSCWGRSKASFSRNWSIFNSITSHRLLHNANAYLHLLHISIAFKVNCYIYLLPAKTAHGVKNQSRIHKSQVRSVSIRFCNSLKDLWDWKCYKWHIRFVEKRMA